MKGFNLINNIAGFGYKARKRSGDSLLSGLFVSGVGFNLFNYGI